MKLEIMKIVDMCWFTWPAYIQYTQCIVLHTTQDMVSTTHHFLHYTLLHTPTQHCTRCQASEWLSQASDWLSKASEWLSQATV